jgi:hypothetical protein
LALSTRLRYSAIKTGNSNPLCHKSGVTALPGFAPDRYRDNSSAGGREKNVGLENARNERPEGKARGAAKPVEQKAGRRASSHRDARQVFCSPERR